MNIELIYVVAATPCYIGLFAALIGWPLFPARLQAITVLNSTKR